MKINIALLEELADEQLEITLVSNEPANYSNNYLINACIVFNALIMDKMWKLQEDENMSIEDRYKMAEDCGKNLYKFIHTYTGIDMHKVVNEL